MDSKTKHTLEAIYILLITFTPVPYNPFNLLFSLVVLLFCYWFKDHTTAPELAQQQVVVAEACMAYNFIGLILAVVFHNFVGIDLFSIDCVNAGMLGLLALMVTVILLFTPVAILAAIFDGLVVLHGGGHRQLDVYILAVVAMVAKITIVCVTNVHYIETFTF